MRPDQDWTAEGQGHRGRGPRGYRRDEKRVYEDVCDRLLADRHVDAYDIEVRLENGEVTLSGTVRDRGMRRRAEEIVEAVGGVTHVHNRLRVQPQGTSEVAAGFGTPVAAAYGLAASPSADQERGDPKASASGTAGLAAREAEAAGGGSHARTIAALFDSEADASRVVDELAEQGVERGALSVIRRDPQGSAAPEPEQPAEQGFLAGLKALFVPEADRHAYAEGIRRGGAVVTAVVQADRASWVEHLLRDRGAVDLDARRGEWRATGWREYEPDPGAVSRSAEP